MWYHIASGQCLETDAAVRAFFPDVSFPAALTAEAVTEFGVCPVVEAPAPAYNQATHKLLSGAVSLAADGSFASRGWEVVPLSVEESAAHGQMQFMAAKAQRQAAVDQIVVTTASGRAFDGDETSQDRMARAICALLPGEQTLWVLASNIPAQVSREELVEALRLAGQAQTAIWTSVYL